MRSVLSSNGLLEVSSCFKPDDNTHCELLRGPGRHAPLTLARHVALAAVPGLAPRRAPVPGAAVAAGVPRQRGRAVLDVAVEHVSAHVAALGALVAVTVAAVVAVAGCPLPPAPSVPAPLGPRPLLTFVFIISKADNRGSDMTTNHPSALLTLGMLSADPNLFRIK